MPIAPGTRLGVYEVTAQIGEGGMGQVYRARDTKLNRDVAIKVLSGPFAAEPERLARFEREAKTLASLNHPHIAAIYGLEEGGGVSALVMELVDGVDLSQRIARRAMPIDEVLPIARQIAEALGAAHERGIIHRDLKPANIRIRSDGTVKVLDFGLAKAIGAGRAGQEGASGWENPSLSPTIMAPALTSGGGAILGTAAYMAPEQARGKIVDKRADIWAFGAVLFEMLTGRRPFDGEDMADVLDAVVRLEPGWDALPADVPMPIRTLLQSCLTKDPRQRAADISIVLFVLDNAASLAAPAATTPVAPAAPTARRGRLAVTALGVTAVMILALAIPAVRHLRETPPPETRVDIVTPATDSPMSFALSPDGRQIVFVASGDGVSRLWLRPLAETTAQPLAGTEGARDPFWSPDSGSVGFFADAKMKRLALTGGAPLTITAAPTVRGASWNADGIILFQPNPRGPLFRVPASGGQPAAVPKSDPHINPRTPFFLADGRHFLFYSPGNLDTAGIYMGALDAPDTHRLTAADTAGVILPAGRGPAGAPREGEWLLRVQAGALVAQRLDVGRQMLLGAPVTLADSVMFDSTLSVAPVSASSSGLVAYRTGAASPRQLTWFDRAGVVRGSMGAPDENGLQSLSVSPDGRRAAVSRTVQGNQDVWLLDGIRASRFSFDAAVDRYPVWSPDGTQIVFDSNRKGPRDLYQSSSGAAGAEKLLLATPQDKVPGDWSADGRFLMYYSADPKTGSDLWVLPLEGDRTPWAFLKTAFREIGGTFSRDGRWVAYQSNESGRAEVYIRPFAASAKSGNAAGGQWQVSTAGGVYPRWSGDGKELYYVAPGGEMMAAPIVANGATVAPGAPVKLFSAPIYGGGADAGQGRQYDVTRDGRFLINTVLAGASAPITLLQNWRPEARK